MRDLIEYLIMMGPSSSVVSTVFNYTSYITSSRGHNYHNDPNLICVRILFRMLGNNRREMVKTIQIKLIIKITVI